MNSLVKIVLENSRQYPSKDALIFRARHITYREFAQKILVFSNYLKQKKIKKGSKIAVEADDPVLFYTVFLAVQLHACIVLPLEKDISLYHLQEILKSQKPAMVFSRHTGEISEDFFSVPCEYELPEADPLAETPTAIISTTGTTGNPVTIVHTNKSILSTAITYLSRVPMTPSSIIYTAVPFHLAGGFRRVLSALSIGATSVISDQPLSPDTISDAIEHYHIDFLCTVHSNIATLLNQDREQMAAISEHIKVVETYAGRLTSAMIMRFYQCYPHSVLYNVYGTTESGCLLVNNTAENPSDSCIGKPTELAVINLVDENGEPVTQPGKYGYFTVQGPMNMREYYKRKALTKQVLSDGVLKINDIGYFDENGYYYYVSRVGDIMNVNGYTIVPDDIETAAIDYPLIEDCACTCVEVSDIGQLPVLYVVTKDGYNKKEFLDFLMSHLEPYKIPAAIREVANIPRTTTGKIIRNVLPMLTTI